MVDSLEELKTPSETGLPPFAAQPPPPMADAKTSYGSYTPPHPPPVSSTRVFTAHSQEREKISRNRKLPLVFSEKCFILSSMDPITTIITAAASLAGLLVTLFFFFWRADKRSEERTNKASERLETQFQTLFAVLQDGQTHLQEGQTQILARMSNLETRVGKLEEGQTQILARLDKLEKGQATLAEGQATLAIEWAKAEIRLKHLEENTDTTQGKIDEISELSHQTNTKTASLDGLIRGYLIREGDILHEAAASG